MAGPFRTAFRLTARVSGVLLGLAVLVLAVLFSMGFFGLVAEVLHRPHLFQDKIPDFLYTAGLGALFSVWAWRLISGRGSPSGGGMLSPFFYRLLGGAFMLTAVWFSCGPSVDSPLEVLFFCCFFGMPGGLCFWAAHRLNRHVHPEHPAA
jgi:hypothetical protein